MYSQPKYLWHAHTSFISPSKSDDVADVGDVIYPHSNNANIIVLLLFLVVFGIGNLIYIGLEIEYEFNKEIPDYCSGTRYGWTFILHLLFVTVQTFFILKVDQVSLTRCCMWDCALSSEWCKAITNFRKPLFWNFGLTSPRISATVANYDWRRVFWLKECWCRRLYYFCLWRHKEAVVFFFLVRLVWQCSVAWHISASNIWLPATFASGSARSSTRFWSMRSTWRTARIQPINTRTWKHVTRQVGWLNVWCMLAIRNHTCLAFLEKSRNESFPDFLSLNEQTAQVLNTVLWPTASHSAKCWARKWTSVVWSMT